jgi:hypothetical protein
MWIALAVVALIAVALVIVTVFRRPSGDDLNSVRSYHSALGTLEHLSDRPGTSTVTVVERDDRAGAEPGVPRSYRRSSGASLRSPAGVGTERSVPPVPVRGNDEFPDPETPLIFDDSRPRDRYRRDLSSDGIPVSRADRVQRHALDSMNHRPRRATTVMIVVAALVLFGVLAYVGSKRSSPSHTHAVAVTSTTGGATSHSNSPTSVGHTTTTPVAKAKAKAKAKTKAKSKPTPTTPTTQPTQVVALTSTSTTATYPVTNANYNVTATGTGTCWVAVTSSSTGSTLWAGELQAGTVQVIPASGTITVQLGTPTVTLAIDKVPVVLPTPVLAPFVATFQPTAAAIAASPPTTSATSTSVPAGSTAAGTSATSSTTPP